MSNHVDERTIATTHRWAARGMWMLSIALAIDLLVRILILKQEPRQYLDISLIWMATIVFVSIGTAASGVALYGERWSKPGLAILIIAAAVAVTATLMGKVHALADLIAIVVSAAGGAFLAVVILRGVHGAWERVTLGRGSRED